MYEGSNEYILLTYIINQFFYALCKFSPRRQTNTGIVLILFCEKSRIYENEINKTDCEIVSLCVYVYSYIDDCAIVID